MPEPELKSEVKAFWNRQSCDTDQARSEKFSLEYFEEIERFRYTDQPFIHSFAQFTRYHGKKVLEVGFGAGTDFIQWLRAGARASGIDLTEEALENLRHRVHIYNLPSPERMEVGDAENLPFASDSFDLGYSFGVLHHSPDTEKALGELVRVVRPGGEIKVMLYNRRSIWTFNLWVRQALFKGRPWKSFTWVLWHHMESVGTKGYTRREIHRMLAGLPLNQIRIQTETTGMDHVIASKWFRFMNPFYRLLARLSGKRLGFFHCITARKAQ
jgi:ubiquinone/menaquinone biosynthesis C-methylase UbiE